MIQFLQQWNGYERYSVWALESGEEARLTGLGLARTWFAGIDGLVYDGTVQVPAELISAPTAAMLSVESRETTYLAPDGTRYRSNASATVAGTALIELGTGTSTGIETGYTAAGTGIPLTADHLQYHDVWRVIGSGNVLLDASVAQDGKARFFVPDSTNTFTLVPHSNFEVGDWIVPSGATANSAESTDGTVSILATNAGKVRVLSAKALWNATGTAILKPDGSEVAVGAYLGEFPWVGRPTVGTAPAVSRWLCTDTLIEYIRNTAATEWLPLGNAKLAGAYTAAHTGTTAATNIADLTIPASMLTGRRVRLVCDFGKTGTAGTCILALRYGGTDLISKTFASNIVAANLEQVVAFTAASQQVTGPAGALPGGHESTSGALLVATEDSTVSKSLQLRLTLANAADSVRLNYAVMLER